MSCEIEYTNEFESWWNSLTVREQIDVTAVVNLLRARGPGLRYPHSSAVKGARHGHLRELRVQSGGRPIRIFYAFDPRRTGILLVGERKIEQERFYRKYVWRADAIYDRYLDELRREGLLTPERGWTR